MHPFYVQTRGKKKTPNKPTTINVKLLVDMKGYGRKGVSNARKSTDCILLTSWIGTITPVAPGRMRNAWYPRQQAEYLSTLRDIKPRDVVPERDFTFGMQGTTEIDTGSTAAGQEAKKTAMPRMKLLPVRLMSPSCLSTIIKSSDIIGSRKERPC